MTSKDYFIKGYFFYIISEQAEDNGSGKCYICSDKDNLNEKIYIPEQVGEKVINDDETFGMLVGGEYAYYGLEAEIKGNIIESHNIIKFVSVDEITLSRGNEKQSFKIT